MAWQAALQEPYPDRRVLNDEVVRLYRISPQVVDAIERQEQPRRRGEAV